ncbi:hypothetical protein [Novosphingobium sp. Leaf2]|uniref:hypothetical protein n=1 Tax=Novosphingobium sp. Leaf2 TaxID=1735670 RepID=UPI001F1BEE17|nr:hypothetical protein [Novosphingobium sp. Leaf2]
MTDAPFQTWLATLPALGYERIWISNNLPGLRKRFDDTGGAAMPACPAPPERARDRYEEL